MNGNYIFCYHLQMMISGATARTGPWPPFTGFMVVYSTMWGYQLHNRPVLDTLIQPSETSSSNCQRLSYHLQMYVENCTSSPDV
jgi:hypothetical protein